MVPAGRSVPDLLGDLIGQFQRLIRTEYLLARAELGENLGKMRAGAVLLVAGAILILPGATVLLWGLALALTRAGVPDYAAGLLVGAAVCIAGAIMMTVALRRMKSVQLVPEKALNHLQRDVAAVNHASHKHEHAAA